LKPCPLPFKFNVFVYRGQIFEAEGEIKFSPAYRHIVILLRKDQRQHHQGGTAKCNHLCSPRPAKISKSLTPVDITLFAPSARRR
jgi:hypothetical protein